MLLVPDTNRLAPGEPNDVYHLQRLASLAIAPFDFRLTTG